MPDTPTETANNKPRILVTGNNGFLGAAICDALRHDYQVIGFDADGEPQPPKEIECVCVDMREDESVKRGLSRVRYAYGDRIESVIHLAAYYDFAGEPSNLYEEVTVQGTRRLLRGLRDFDVGQFIFSSSMLVHAPTEPGKPFDERQPLQPKWDYPESKVRAEEVIEQERGNVPAVILRIAGAYTDACDSIPLSQQMRRIYENRLTSHVYPGELSHGQALVHVDDIVRAFQCAVEKRGKLPDSLPLLIGESETVSYGELQRSFGDMLKGEPDWMTETIPKSVAQTGAWVQGKIPGIEEPFIKPWMIDLADDHYELNTAAAQKHLGWQCEHTLRDALPNMAQFLVERPRDFYRRHGFDPDSVPKDAQQRERVGAS
jgi:nucleoside-diphosphate-sugar epimerase